MAFDHTPGSPFPSGSPDADALCTPELPAMIARPDGVIVWANAPWCSLCAFGGTEDVIGRDIRCIQGPGTDREELKRLMESVRAHQSVSATLFNYDRHGRPFRHTVDVVPLAGPDGHVTLFRATSRDIVRPGSETHGKRTLDMANGNDGIDGRRTVDTCHAALQGCDELLHAEPLALCGGVPYSLPLPYPSAPSMVVLTQARPPFSIVWASAGWLEVCKYSAAEIVGGTLALIQGPGTDREAVRTIMAAAHAQKSVDNVALINYDKRGQPFRHVLSMAPVYRDGQHTSPTLLRATSHDVWSLAPGGRACAASSAPCEGSFWPGLAVDHEGALGEEGVSEVHLWGEELEELGYAWSHVASSLELLDLEGKVAMAHKRSSAATF